MGWAEVQRASVPGKAPLPGQFHMVEDILEIEFGKITATKNV